MTARLSPQREANPYMPLSDERLESIRALRDAITPSPWKTDDRVGVVTDETGSPLAVFGGGVQDRADAAFVAESPEAVADLLVEVDWQRRWSAIGWSKANAYNELWVAADLDLSRLRGLVCRLRLELSRQAQQRNTEVDRLRAELAEVRAERDEAQQQLAEYEPLNPQQCPAGKHTDWLVDSEFSHACPWCQIDELKAELAAKRDGLKQRIARAIYALPSPSPSTSEHYRSGWDVGLEASVDAARTALDGEARS